eukprot:GILJ01001281.1.p1 GENE.GILJ01001281.1~~GILJ01001281.1.p1  ORF type:complete len:2151 (-),score=467.22 GILJ01001281.1:191-5722(-)
MKAIYLEYQRREDAKRNALGRMCLSKVQAGFYTWKEKLIAGKKLKADPRRAAAPKVSYQTYIKYVKRIQSRFRKYMYLKYGADSTTSRKPFEHLLQGKYMDSWYIENAAKWHSNDQIGLPTDKFHDNMSVSDLSETGYHTHTGEAAVEEVPTVEKNFLWVPVNLMTVNWAPDHDHVHFSPFIDVSSISDVAICDPPPESAYVLPMKAAGVNDLGNKILNTFRRNISDAQKQLSDAKKQITDALPKNPFSPVAASSLESQQFGRSVSRFDSIIEGISNRLGIDGNENAWDQENDATAGRAAESLLSWEVEQRKNDGLELNIDARIDKLAENVRKQKELEDAALRAAATGANRLPGVDQSLASKMAHVTIHVLEAQGLRKADISGTSDPYCKIKIENREEHTRVVWKDCDPVWDETFQFYVLPSLKSDLQITLMDRDKVKAIRGADDFLGYVTIPLKAMRSDEKVERWFDLKSDDKFARTKVTGKIKLGFEFVMPPDMEKEKSTAQTDDIYKSDTAALRYHEHPHRGHQDDEDEWENSWFELRGSNPVLDDLNNTIVRLAQSTRGLIRQLVTLRSQAAKNPGQYSRDTDDQIRALQQKINEDARRIKELIREKDSADVQANRAWVLKLRANNCVEREMFVKYFKKLIYAYHVRNERLERMKKKKMQQLYDSRRLVLADGRPLPPAGQIVIEVLEARNLRKADLIGKSDPYVQVFLSSRNKPDRTPTIENDQNPKWFDSVTGRCPPSCTFRYRFDTLEEFLTFSVYDHDVLTADDLLGVARVNLREIVDRQKPAMDLWVPLEGANLTEGDLHIRTWYRPKAGYVNAMGCKGAQDWLAKSVQFKTAEYDSLGFKIDTNVQLYRNVAALYRCRKLRQSNNWEKFFDLVSVKNYVDVDMSLAKLANTDANKILFELVKLGIPDNLRPSLWNDFAGAKQKLETANNQTGATYNTTIYKTLVERFDAVESAVFHQVDEDLNAVLLKKEIQMDESYRLDTRAAAVRIAKAFYLRHGSNKTFGYKLSLIKIVSVLLLSMSEEAVFWLLCALAEDVIPEYFISSASGIKADVLTMIHVGSKVIPEVFGVLAEVGIPVHVLIFKWLSSLYLGFFPAETVWRIWDVLFYSKSHVNQFAVINSLPSSQRQNAKSQPILVGVGLAFLSLIKDQFLEERNRLMRERSSPHQMIDSLMQFLNHAAITMWDVDLLMHRAYEIMDSNKFVKGSGSGDRGFFYTRQNYLEKMNQEDKINVANHIRTFVQTWNLTFEQMFIKDNGLFQIMIGSMLNYSRIGKQYTVNVKSGSFEQVTYEEFHSFFAPIFPHFSHEARRIFDIVQERDNNDRPRGFISMQRLLSLFIMVGPGTVSQKIKAFYDIYELMLRPSRTSTDLEINPGVTLSSVVNILYRVYKVYFPRITEDAIRALVESAIKEYEAEQRDTPARTTTSTTVVGSDGRKEITFPIADFRDLLQKSDMAMDTLRIDTARTCEVRKRVMLALEIETIEKFPGTNTRRPVALEVFLNDSVEQVKKKLDKRLDEDEEMELKQAKLVADAQRLELKPRNEWTSDDQRKVAEVAKYPQNFKDRASAIIKASYKAAKKKSAGVPVRTSIREIRLLLTGGADIPDRDQMNEPNVLYQVLYQQKLVQQPNLFNAPEAKITPNLRADMLRNVKRVRLSTRYVPTSVKETDVEAVSLLAQEEDKKRQRDAISRRASIAKETARADKEKKAGRSSVSASPSSSPLRQRDSSPPMGRPSSTTLASLYAANPNSAQSVGSPMTPPDQGVYGMPSPPSNLHIRTQSAGSASPISSSPLASPTGSGPISPTGRSKKIRNQPGSMSYGGQPSAMFNPQPSNLPTGPR